MKREWTRDNLRKLEFIQKSLKYRGDRRNARRLSRTVPLFAPRGPSEFPRGPMRALAMERAQRRLVAIAPRRGPGNPDILAMHRAMARKLMYGKRMKMKPVMAGSTEAGRAVIA